MISLRLVLLVLALVCFIGATVNVQTKINLTGLGLALWVLSLLIA